MEPIEGMSFRHFCDACFPERFNGWTVEQWRAAAAFERASAFGEFSRVKMGRAGGKTTLAMAAVWWAALTQMKQFVVVASANIEYSKALIDMIWSELYHSPVLNGALGNERKRSRVDKSRNWIDVAGCTIAGRSVISGARGLKVQRHGVFLRPDFLIIDDPLDVLAARSVAASELVAREVRNLRNAGAVGTRTGGVELWTPN